MNSDISYSFELLIHLDATSFNHTMPSICKQRASAGHQNYQEYIASSKTCKGIHILLVMNKF